MSKYKSIMAVLLCVLLIALNGCDKDTAVKDYNRIIEKIGDNNLTADHDLQGKREFGTDEYVGTYECNYKGYSGEEILFGGTSVDRKAGNKIDIGCELQIDDGSIEVYFKSGSDERKVLLDRPGSYKETLELPAASDYVGIKCYEFSGTINLNIE